MAARALFRKAFAALIAGAVCGASIAAFALVAALAAASAASKAGNKEAPPPAGAACAQTWAAQTSAAHADSAQARRASAKSQASLEARLKGMTAEEIGAKPPAWFKGLGEAIKHFKPSQIPAIPESAILALELEQWEKFDKEQMQSFTRPQIEAAMKEPRRFSAIAIAARPNGFHADIIQAIGSQAIAGMWNRYPYIKDEELRRIYRRIAGQRE